VHATQLVPPPVEPRGADVACDGGVWYDSVPNIKFNVAKLTAAFVPLVGASVVESQIRPCLLELNSDTDLDVRFFAGACLSPPAALSLRAATHGLAATL
jgi:hypothetical protein